MKYTSSCCISLLIFVLFLSAFATAQTIDRVEYPSREVHSDGCTDPTPSCGRFNLYHQLYESNNWRHDYSDLGPVIENCGTGNCVKDEFETTLDRDCYSNESEWKSFEGPEEAKKECSPCGGGFHYTDYSDPNYYYNCGKCGDWINGVPYYYRSEKEIRIIEEYCPFECVESDDCPYGNIVKSENGCNGCTEGLICCRGPGQIGDEHCQDKCDETYVNSVGIIEGGECKCGCETGYEMEGNECVPEAGGSAYLDLFVDPLEFNHKFNAVVTADATIEGYSNIVKPMESGYANFEFEFLEGKKVLFKEGGVVKTKNNITSGMAVTKVTIPSMLKENTLNRHEEYPLDMIVKVNVRVHNTSTGRSHSFSGEETVHITSPVPKIKEMKISPKPVKMHEGPYTVIVKVEDDDSAVFEYALRSIGGTPNTTGKLSPESTMEGATTYLVEEKSDDIYSAYFTPAEFGFNSNEAALARRLEDSGWGFVQNTGVQVVEEGVKKLAPKAGRYVPIIKAPLDGITLGNKAWDAWEMAHAANRSVNTKEKVFRYIDLGLQGLSFSVGVIAVIPKQFPVAGWVVDLTQNGVDSFIGFGQAYAREAAYEERSKFAQDVTLYGIVVVKVTDQDGYSTNHTPLGFDIMAKWVVPEGG